MNLEAFMQLKDAEPARFKHWRQQSKALNFGIPGGLGPASLVRYARSTYQVEMTIEEAAQFRERLIREVYPELGRYLDEDPMELLAAGLGVPVSDCWATFDRLSQRPPALARAIRNVVRGRALKADGTPYDTRFCNRVWDELLRLADHGPLSGAIAERRGSEVLERLLYGSDAVTLTGRVRGEVTYCQSRNTAFQGLAADGAKLALWTLVRDGYRVVAF